MAYDFSANATDKVQAASVANPAAVTWAVRVYRTGPGGNSAGRVWQKNNHSFELFNNGPNYELDLEWSTTVGKWVFTRPTDNAWHDILVTYDGSQTANNPVVWIDGASVTVTRSQAPAGGFNVVAANWNIGNSNTNARNFGGYLCEFAWWNRVLTANEISLLAKNYSAVSIPNGQKMYVPLIRDVYDYRNAAPVVTGTAVVTHPRVLFPIGAGRQPKPATVSPYIDIQNFGDRMPLAWNANSEGDLAGYKVYYGTASGMYGAPIDVGNVTTATILNLTTGLWYYFAVSAYDTSGNEGPKSDELQATPTNGFQINTDAGVVASVPARGTRLINASRCRGSVGRS